MFKTLIEKSLKGEAATMSPRVIDYVYSKDAARSTILAADAVNVKSRIYNVGMGKIYTPAEIISILSSKIPSAKVTIEDLQIGNPAVKAEDSINLDRSRDEIGYKPLYDMSKALEDYIGVYRVYRGSNT